MNPRNFTRFLTVVSLAAAASFSMAQNELTGFHQYPQFRTISGLPGGGFGVNIDGYPDSNGAIAISTPIAFALSHWSFVLGGSEASRTSSFIFPSFHKETVASSGNGTGQFMVGAPLGRAGSLTGSIMVLSGLGDNAFNFQYTPGWQTGPVRFAVGVQDLRGNGGASGAGIKGDGDSSTSFFAVTTYQLPHDSYLSLGTGNRRFHNAFGSLSLGVTPGVKAVGEYDSFNWNFGLSLGIDRIFGFHENEEIAGVQRHLQPTIFIGAIRGKYAYWSLNFAF